MNRSTFYILVISILLISNLVLATLLFVKKSHPPFGEGPKKLIIEKLHFDEQQVDAYEKLIQTHRRQIRVCELSLNKAKQDLYEQLKEKNRNIDSLYTAIASEQSKIEQIHFKHFEDIKNLCKPEQKKYFDALTEELTILFSLKHPPKK